MQLVATDLSGLFVVEPQPLCDERGFFARMFDTEVFRQAGLATQWAQASRSFSTVAGTLRGMHFQTAPHEEDKLIRCTRGAIFDVALDLRERSATYRRWFGLELSAGNGRMLYIPKGFAHGFVTLKDASEVEYWISPAYAPAAGAGVRWNDPAFAIRWPREPRVISARDANWPFAGDA